MGSYILSLQRDSRLVNPLGKLVLVILYISDLMWQPCSRSNQKALYYVWTQASAKRSTHKSLHYLSNGWERNTRATAQGREIPRGSELRTVVGTTEPTSATPRFGCSDPKRRSMLMSSSGGRIKPRARASQQAAPSMPRRSGRPEAAELNRATTSTGSQ